MDSDFPNVLRLKNDLLEFPDIINDFEEPFKTDLREFLAEYDLYCKAKIWIEQCVDRPNYKWLKAIRSEFHRDLDMFDHRWETEISSLGMLYLDRNRAKKQSEAKQKEARIIELTKAMELSEQDVLKFKTGRL